MKKLYYCNATYDDDLLISYNTPIAQMRGDILLIRDYPTITSKKHLRLWLEIVFEDMPELLAKIFELMKATRKKYGSCYYAINLQPRNIDYLIEYETTRDYEVFKNKFEFTWKFISKYTLYI